MSGNKKAKYGYVHGKKLLRVMVFGKDFLLYNSATFYIWCALFLKDLMLYFP